MSHSHRNSVSTAKKNSQSTHGRSATQTSVSTTTKKKQKRTAKEKNSILKSTYGIAYATKGDRVVNPSKVCQSSQRKDITLNEDEYWVQVKIVPIKKLTN